jgi:transcription initiation factor IIE alpha subunit
MLEKVKKHCSNCDTKYSVEWNIEEQDLEPSTCPFCGHEVELGDVEDEVEERYENDNDSWD